MRIHILTAPPTAEQIQEMLVPHGTFIKLAVDVRRRRLAGGGEMHADCEAALLRAGSQQDDVWGADWVPDTGEVRFESLINIRPRLGNRYMMIESESLLREIDDIVREVFAA